MSDEFLYWDEVQVVRKYLSERRRRSTCPGTLTRDPDLPRIPHVDDGKWEQLIWLMKGLSERHIAVLEAFTYDSAGVVTEVYEAIPPTQYESLWEWQSADPESRGNLAEFSHQVALPVTPQHVALKLKMRRSDVVDLREDAYRIVATNLGKLRRSAR